MHHRVALHGLPLSLVHPGTSRTPTFTGERAKMSVTFATEHPDEFALRTRRRRPVAFTQQVQRALERRQARRQSPKFPHSPPPTR